MWTCPWAMGHRPWAMGRGYGLLSALPVTLSPPVAACRCVPTPQSSSCIVAFTMHRRDGSFFLSLQCNLSLHDALVMVPLGPFILHHLQHHSWEGPLQSSDLCFLRSSPVVCHVPYSDQDLSVDAGSRCLIRLPSRVPLQSTNRRSPRCKW